jgi:hypothetical protein
MIQTLKMSDEEVRLAVERYLTSTVFAGEYAKKIYVEKLEQIKTGGYSGGDGFDVTIGEKQPEVKT